MNKTIDALQSIIDKSENIVFFGGAGVSTESGIPDFRSADGLYHQHYQYPPEEVVSHDFFWAHTAAFYAFYKERMLYPKAQPNPAHKALAALERAGRLKAVITQNIDGLHQMAGSREVLELHGSVHRNFCTQCGRFFELAYILDADGVPVCPCGGIIKPDVVLYGEGLEQDILEQSIRYIQAADVLLVGGTSLNVYPAAGLLRYFGGRHLVLINKTETPADSAADIVIHAPIGAVLEEIQT